MIETRHLWQAARILAACILAYGGSRLIGLPEGYWALITSVVVTQPALGETLMAGRNRVLGTLIGAATGFAVIFAGQYGMPRFFLFWIAMAPLALLSALAPNLRLSCITLIVIVLVPSSGPSYARPIDRVFGILMGTVASIAVSAIMRTRPRPDGFDA